MKDKFGKSSLNIIKVKKDFFDNNNKWLKENSKILKFYSKQPKRTRCKNCNAKLEYNKFFIKEKIKYIICSNCNHLNGIYEDTKEFCDYLYSDNKGLMYSKSYHEKNIKAYMLRTKEIYIPKAKFLLSSLKKQTINIKNLNFADIGSGSGYFVNALLSLGIKKLIGYDVSKTQVALANKMLGKEILKLHNLKDINQIISNINADVVSLIGVLEHMQYPAEFLKSVKRNKKIKYLYISVPTFSLSVFFEMVFPKIMQRQLSGDHTHLYTKESLDWLIKNYKFKKIKAWWFGSDMMDLYRNMALTLFNNQNTNKVSEVWEKNFLKCLDNLQLIIDKNYLASEVHILLKTR